jgi:hypothetical protein
VGAAACVVVATGTRVVVGFGAAGAFVVGFAGAAAERVGEACAGTDADSSDAGDLVGIVSEGSELGRPDGSGPPSPQEVRQVPRTPARSAIRQRPATPATRPVNPSSL